MTVQYASARNITSKSVPNPPVPVPHYTAYARPSDWAALPSISPTDQKFTGLYAVYDTNSNFVAVRATVVTGGSTYSVDWGDGTTTTGVASNTTAQKNLSYAGISSSVTTRGYKTAVITITPDSGNLSVVNLQQLYTNTPVLTKYNARWLDIKCGSPNLTNWTIGQNGGPVFMNMLEQVELVSKATGYTGFGDWLYQCFALQNVIIGANMSNVISTTAMFYNCISLQTTPYFDTSSVTDISYMFGLCTNLRFIPQYNFVNVTTAQFTFTNCTNLVELPPLNIGNCTNTNNMFALCEKLTYIPYINTAKLSNSQAMFTSCVSLEQIPVMNLANLTVSPTMFSGCVSLNSVPPLNLGNTTTTLQMFLNCSSLSEVNDIVMPLNTTTAQMFSGCSSLTTVPAFNMANVSNAVQMFNACRSLESTPAFNTPNLTTTSSMFAGCNSLSSIATFDTSKVSNTVSMFSACFNLEDPPTLNTSNVVTATSMFTSCIALKGDNMPTYDFGNVTGASGMFNTCTDLVSVPTFNLSKATTVGSMFNACTSLVSIPAFNLSNVSSASTGFATGANSQMSCNITGLKTSVDFTNNQMSQTALETLFTNLGSPATAQTLTITGNYGADTAVAKTGTWNTVAKTVTITASGSVNIGQYMYSSTAIQAIACSFTDVTDLVTVTAAPGVAPIAGTLLQFSSIVSTTGITVSTLYYCINPVGATFQVALTPGGSAVPLTTNGTGTLKWALKVTNVVGTTITLDNYAMVAGTSLAITFRTLNTNLASFKNWNVTG